MEEDVSLSISLLKYGITVLHPAAVSTEHLRQTNMILLSRNILLQFMQVFIAERVWLC